jgi:hypothetical protein
MLRWHRALQDGSILDDKSTAKLYGHHAAEPGGTWYGYGWVTEEAPWGATIITHNGGNPYFFADYLRFPEDDVVIYLWTTSRQARLKDLSRPLASIVYGGPVPALQPPPPPLMAIDTNTPVGAVAARMLEIVVGDAPGLRAELIGETIHPELLDKHGATKIADLAASVREEIGDYRLLGIRQYPDDRVDIEFDTVQGVFALELGLQDRQGPMVRSIGLRIGD